jgi:hypothetical protein
LYDTPSDVNEMAVGWTAEDASGKAALRSMEKRFFIDETSDVLGEEITIDVVFKDAIIFQDTLPVNWKQAVCSKADGPRWCADDVYEWAKIEIDLRTDEDLKAK